MTDLEDAWNHLSEQYREELLNHLNVPPAWIGQALEKDWDSIFSSTKDIIEREEEEVWKFLQDEGMMPATEERQRGISLETRDEESEEGSEGDEQKTTLSQKARELREAIREWKDEGKAVLRGGGVSRDFRAFLHGEGYRYQRDDFKNGDEVYFFYKDGIYKGVIKKRNPKSARVYVDHSGFKAKCQYGKANVGYGRLFKTKMEVVEESILRAHMNALEQSQEKEVTDEYAEMLEEYETDFGKSPMKHGKETKDFKDWAWRTYGVQFEEEEEASEGDEQKTTLSQKARELRKKEIEKKRTMEKKDWSQVPLKWIEEITGIGESHVDALREAGHDNVQSVLDAEDLTEVSGIGKATAEKIREGIKSDVPSSSELEPSLRIGEKESEEEEEEFEIEEVSLESPDPNEVKKLAEKYEHKSVSELIKMSVELMISRPFAKEKEQKKEKKIIKKEKEKEKKFKKKYKKISLQDVKDFLENTDFTDEELEELSEIVLNQTELGRQFLQRKEEREEKEDIPWEISGDCVKVSQHADWLNNFLSDINDLSVYEKSQVFLAKIIDDHHRTFKFDLKWLEAKGSKTCRSFRNYSTPTLENLKKTPSAPLNVLEEGMLLEYRVKFYHKWNKKENLQLSKYFKIKEITKNFVWVDELTESGVRDEF